MSSARRQIAILIDKIDSTYVASWGREVAILLLLSVDELLLKCTPVSDGEDSVTDEVEQNKAGRTPRKYA